ncbi:MAG: hypothetical protein CM15mP32_4260 [Flavobacteriaceae bacterium]|nr:MAG: hypothetical protein CM15mP32_4260 [Flavobacteriaceae bacterium]
MERYSIWYWPAVQPWFTLPELTSGLELGVWGSFLLIDGGMLRQTYELDLYASMILAHFALTVTNYTFPTQLVPMILQSYELFDGDMEVSASTSLGAIGLTVGILLI